MTKTLTWAAVDATRPLTATLLHFVAGTLQTTSDLLTRLAVRLSTAEAIPASAQTVEFHALYGDAGAPEGALYVNGELVGRIAGVRRL
jgi:hypothetical protein